jgi:hypothetical protein
MVNTELKTKAKIILTYFLPIKWVKIRSFNAMKKRDKISYHTYIAFLSYFRVYVYVYVYVCSAYVTD